MLRGSSLILLTAVLCLGTGIGQRVCVLLPDVCVCEREEELWGVARLLLIKTGACV